MKKLPSWIKWLALAVAIVIIALTINVGLGMRNDNRLEALLNSKTPAPLQSIEFSGQQRSLLLSNPSALDYLSRAITLSKKFAGGEGVTYAVVITLANGEKIQAYAGLYETKDGLTIFGPDDSNFKDPIPYEIRLKEPIPPDIIAAFDSLLKK